ncbi:amidase family protein [Paraburkholderia xenovorans]|uniref:amidase family protein n=1 Tax=Paraburkholderia xenovorans TaxID=36873 RepID=UPI0038BA6C33
MSFDEQDYVSADATALAQAIAEGRTDSSTLLSIARARAQRLNPVLGAISHFSNPHAMATGSMGNASSASTFNGVPIAVKDLGAPLAGVPTFAGSRVLQRVDQPAPHDGALIGALKQAGLIPFAKTTVPEFGLNLSSEPACGPASRNPWALEFSSGGSSGGSAAAVAAGIVPIAHATDAGGSIRIPAAACGVLGLKPGRNVIRRGPDYGNVFGTLAAEFVVTRSVRDAQSVWQAVTGQHALLHLPRLNIVLMVDAPQGVPVDPAWQQAAVSAAAVMEAAGHKITSITPQHLHGLRQASADATLAFETYACRSAAAAALALAPRDGEFESITWCAARRGESLNALDHQQAEVAVARATDIMSDLFADFDVLLTPALALPLPEIGVLRTDGEDLDAHFARFTRYAPFSPLANAAGCPAIAVPHGSALGRPLSVQLMARQRAEPLLLALAAQLESRAPWPPVAPGFSS